MLYNHWLEPRRLVRSAAESPIAKPKGRLCGEEEDRHKTKFTDFIGPKTPAFTRFYLLYYAFLGILKSKKMF